MPERKKVDTAPPVPASTVPLKGSPLQNLVHKFLGDFDLLDKVAEETERFVQEAEAKVKGLFLVFDTDENAKECARQHIKSGYRYTSGDNELIMVGYPKTEDGDDLIVMFYFVPKADDDVMSSGEGDVLAEVKKHLKKLKVKFPETQDDVVADDERGVVYVLLDENGQREVCWDFVSADNQSGSANLGVIGDDTMESLAFYIL